MLSTGMEHVFLALLAWTFGAITKAVGLDQLFSNLIAGVGLLKSRGFPPFHSFAHLHS
jgi:Na+/H+ antiporter NhaC